MPFIVAIEILCHDILRHTHIAGISGVVICRSAFLLYETLQFCRSLQ